MARYAAIDIGSNSIRFLVAEVNPPEPRRVLASDRQVVRLGAGVFREGKMSQVSMDLAFEVLKRMAGAYAGLDVMGVRAVGTAALRDASNQKDFLGRAAEVLHTPVEVISGLEEARLVHLGVQSQWPHPKQRLVLLDVGGGSAELILSDEGHFVQAFSKPLGAVRLTELFLKSDPPDARELARMEKYVQERVAGSAKKFASKKVDRMIATSSTAAATVCAINGIKRSRRDEGDRASATASQIRRLYKELSVQDLEGRNKVSGIGPRRAEIIVAGTAVLSAVIEELGLTRLYYSSAGVRDGIIADLAHRKVGMEQARMEDDQRRVVLELAHKYDISAVHVRKVAELGNMLFDGLLNVHQLPLACGRLLETAAHLYNIGHFVNEARHHRHSMYLVANSDLPGFSDRERLTIATLCRYHRKSLPQPSHDAFQALHEEDRHVVKMLTPLLRLAVALDQSQEQKVHRLETLVHDAGVELRLYSERDVDIEQWHAQKAGEAFREVYGKSLTVKAKR